MTEKQFSIIVVKAWPALGPFFLLALVGSCALSGVI
jgi:hypothetical protein